MCYTLLCSPALLVSSAAALVATAAARGGSDGRGDDFRSATGAFIIGDLHADMHCAQEWVRKSGLVDLQATPWAWKGDSGEALVFLGDYVDKGWQGRQVLEFVRNLTTQFPQNVLAMLGNHDLFLLLDALLEDGAAQLMGTPVRDFAYSFTHPEEYLNWIPEEDVSVNDTTVLLPALFEALSTVYNKQEENKVFLRAIPGQANLFTAMSPFKEDAALAQATQDRLKQWQLHFYKGLIDTGLAAWLLQRPLVALVGGALVVHGGLPLEMLLPLRQQPQGQKQGLFEELARVTTEALRRLWDSSSSRRLSSPASVPGRLEELLGGGNVQLIHELVAYRGLHKSCKEVTAVLKLFTAETGAEVIAVGHTPEDNVRLKCDGRLAAADSSLSRYFRQYGNLYCPMRTRLPGQVNHERDCASPVPGQCEGQAVRLRRRGDERHWAFLPVKMTSDAEGGRKEEL